MKRVVEIIHNALFGVVQDRRGGIATFLAATIIPLVAFTGLAVDTARGYLMKSRLSYALDSAALAGGRHMDNPTLRDQMIDKFFHANFPDNYMGATITGPTVAINPGNNTISLDASANMSTSLMRVLGLNNMEVGGNTEVKLSSVNLEVSLVLDITGSMDGQPIVDLREAAKDLVDIIVKDSQSPHYSKVALVPYSAGVNVGSYAAQVRGAIPPAKSMSNATKTSPVVVTATSHGFADGDKVYINGVNGMWQLNNRFFRVDDPTANTFELRNESDSSNISGTGYNNYSSDGNVWCTVTGCQYFRFTNANSDLQTFEPSTCATERTGANAYNDVAPSTSLVGIHYPAPNNPCPASEIVPLTSDKTLLKNAIDDFDALGSTAGQIGIAWGWYMISPNFGYLWPADSQPAAYGADELLKVAIIMTDGEFNTGYADGVVAQDSGSGSGSNSYKINKNATNVSQHPGHGSSYSQALQLCAAMKTAGILIYTVGFNIGGLTEAQDIIEQCATDPSYVYMADGGTELAAAFQAIAVNVSQLRLSK